MVSYESTKISSNRVPLYQLGTHNKYLLNVKPFVKII